MVTSIAGTTRLTKCEDRLANAVADSPAFQTFVLAVGATAARAFIRIAEVEDTGADDDDEHIGSDWVDKFPMAIIEDTEGAIEYEHTSDGGPYGYVHNVELVLAIEGLRSENQNNEDAHREFKDVCLNIIEQVIGVQDTAGTKYFVTRCSHSPVLWADPNVEGSSDRMRMEFTLLNEVG